MGGDKTMKAGSFAIAALCALGIALLGSAPAQAQEPPVQVLVFHGPSDARTTAGVTAIEELGAAHDFGVEATDEATAFTPDNLDDYRAVIFLNTVGDVLNTAQENALQGYIEDGGGFFGIGEVAEAEEGNSFFTGLLGARPNPNSSTAPSTQTLAVGDRVHPSTRELPLELDREDIWYRWATRPTGQVHTVARYHATNAPAGDGTNVGGTDHPISWCRDYEGGRSFYTGMGRTAASYAEADFRDHLLGAIQWTAGLLRGNCKATINSNYDVQRLTSAGPEGTGLATGGENHGLVVAPNGWVIYIGRADCRTDAERGNVFGSPPIARELNYASPNAGMGCGSVHVWDPEQHEEGNVNSGVTRAGVLAVHGDMGQGGERTNEPNHKIETGLLGIALSPDFMQTGHVYLQYFPSYNPNSTPPGLPIERRISKMSQGRISRFTMNLQTKQLDLSSEVRIFQYDSQVFSCCHRGGGMGFDSQGNLYVTTGDSNSSQGTGGYSGNNQLPTCPTGPVDEASSNHCGDAAYSYQDARRTAGSTNDYNGKMLRLRPIPNVPKGTPVGEGSTYTIPGETAPNGPNLFDGSEGGGGKTKREIYAMGLRNPSRLSIDPETDVPYSAWVGPDAGAPSGTLGPSTYESAAQIDRAGNYGWPYCMGNKQAYRDRTDVLDPNDPDDREPTGEPRTVNGPGYVNGGPAGQPIPGWYDCDNIVNDSKNNTGLSGLLPHETGTGMDAGTMRPSNVWYSRGNPGGNGCPDFPRENGAGNAPNYAAQNTQLCPYATANGATIMNGPVYRYREAGDNSRRWPEYWDGRWFLFDQGNTSIKHGLLLDPATDQDGGQPIYADSLRNMETWQGAYMDSKFGPDGALYVANYQGFFRAPPGMGIFRMDYTGGPSTPFASPTGVAIGDNRVRYSSAGSGGVEYLWEFDDGTTSTQANPVHQYATPGEHTATLTVTYADGETSRRTVTVDVLEEEDTAAPSTSASLRPASPGPGGTYHVPVTTTLTATDTGGTGVAETHYTINGGPELEYSEPFTVSEPDDYVIEFWSEDNAGNVESPHKQVTFRIELVNTCPTDLSDEFTAGPLSDEWEVLRRDDTAISFAGGRLGLQIRSGDMLGGTATAKNVLLKELPEEGNWTATTKFDASELDAEGQQAGLIVWESENPNQFAKVVFIDKGTFEQFEYYTTVNNSPGVLQTQPVTNPPGDVYLRARSNGEGTIFAEWSYDGNEWNQLGAPIRDLGTDLKVGLKVSDNADSTATARFDYFRVDCTDQIAPVTTATVDPERPDGELGWYRTEPTVTLEATDGEAGDGVDRIEYAVDGGEFQEYGGPFTVTGPGEHMVEYRAIDRSPYANQEPTKTLNLWVDPQPASTTASVTGAGNERQVSLEAGDGSGSGVERIEYRVDGGEWQTYDGPAPEEAIMDGTQASLDRWKMAGPGGFDLQPDGSIQGRGGLGMLWYPVEALGDFSLKLQFRDARTDVGHSNSGVFVRFPNPDEVLAPGADRPSCISAEESRPEWVAIFCGQEIQIYDGPTGEPQKTGSVYNFDPLNLEQANPLAKGEWNDYEIRIVGQDYLMIRNGVVINRFDNAIPRDSSRGGDPPTQERQFDRGYIGFQNHGDVDKIQIRNVRVQDLAERSGTGPFRVSGAGNHTVEYRTLDVAGNIEQTKSVSFRIGTPPQPSPPGGGTPPGTTPPDAEPPAQPGLARFSLLGPRRSITTRRLTRRGLTMRIDCTDRMQGVARLRVSRAWARRLDLGRRRTLASKRVRCAASGLTRVTLKPSRGVARKLRRYDRTHRRAVRAVLEVRLKAPFERTRKVTRRVTIR
jgi:PKD repeat protein/glucose/arabinose dehydrogenase/type 1 glutamine amidotransferase